MLGYGDRECQTVQRDTVCQTVQRDRVCQTGCVKLYGEARRKLYDYTLREARRFFFLFFLRASREVKSQNFLRAPREVKSQNFLRASREVKSQNFLRASREVGLRPRVCQKVSNVVIRGREESESLYIPPPDCPPLRQILVFVCIP